jgi:glutamate racemase
MNNPIGIIDSGVGGLSIVSVLSKKLPNESLIYLADSKNCPYGNKTSREIYNLAKQMLEYLIKDEVKLVLIACNTITVSSILKLRKDYPQIPIVGIVPVIKTAVKETKNGKIGVFSTVVTAKSKQQNDLIKEFAKGCKVTNTGSAKLVSLIEKLDFKAVNKILDQELGVFKTNKVDVLVLGCSHFSLIRDRIQKYLPKVLILDSGEAVVRQVRRILEHNKMLSNSGKASYNFYTTGSLETLNFFAGKLTNRAKLSRISLR